MIVQKHCFSIADCRCEAWSFAPDRWCRPSRLPTVAIVPGGHGLASRGKDGDCGQGLLELAKALTADGYVTFAYNGRGQGRSDGFRSGHAQYVEDLHAALACLKERVAAADPQRLGLLGQSVGGMSAVLAAPRDSGIRSLILWGTLPRYTVAKDDRIKRLIEEAWAKSGKGKPWDEFFRDYDLIDPIDHVSNVHQAILFAGGLSDKAFYVHDEQVEFMAAARNALVTMRLDVNHETHRMNHWAPHFPALARAFSSWFSSFV